MRTRGTYPRPAPWATAMPGYLASNWGIKPSNANNSPAWNALISTVRGSTRGGRIYIDGGDCDFKTTTNDPGGAPVEIWGAGTNVTRLRAAGPLLTSGDLFAPKRQWRMFGLTVGATAARSAGRLINVVGDMKILDAPASDLRNWEFGDVSLQNGFDGVALTAGVGGLGVCGFFWDGGYSIAHGFAANGTVFDINTPSTAGVITIAHVTHSETAAVADGSRPAATVRVRDCGDLLLENVESIFSRRGLVIDPAAGAVGATIFAKGCIWGQVTQEAVLINPDAAATCHTLEATGGYIDTGGISINAFAKAVYMVNVAFLGNSPNDAIKLDGTTASCTFENMMFSGGNAKCFHALNNARNFRLTGAFSNVIGNNTVGVHLEAGTNKYQIQTVGSEYCTTPLTEPTPGANRLVSMF